MTQTIVIKIGTESLTQFETSEKIYILIQTIVEKIAEGKNIILLTSGAVGYGRYVLDIEKNDAESKSLIAAVGWDVLLSRYREKFCQYQVHVAGFLVTHADLEDSTERTDIFRRTIHESWRQGILPIVNENDALSIEELDVLARGGDNDRNALLLAKLFEADQLILLTNTNGVYGDRGDVETRIAQIHISDMTDAYLGVLCGGVQSMSGTGGMYSKLIVAREAAQRGIHVHIGDGIHSGLHDQRSGGTNIIS